MSADKPSPGASPADFLLREAFAHHGAGRLAEAAALYERVLEVEPENPDALHLRGALRYQEGAFEKALALVDYALSVMPGAADYHNTRGLVLRGLGREEEAESALERALEIAPDHGEARANLGAVLTKRADGLLESAAHEEAQALGRRIVELTPEYATAHNNLGKVLAAAGKDGEAVEAFTKAAALDPSFAAAHFNLGTLLQKTGESERAVAILERAIAIDPDQPQARSNLGLALQALGRFDEAMAAFNRAIELDSECAGAHNNLGSALLAAGRTKEAEAAIRRALAIDPGDATAQGNLGNALRARGKPVDSLNAYEASVKMAPEDIALHNNLSHALLLTGDFSRGWEEYEWRTGNKDAIRRPFSQPQWDGSSLAGKTILVWGEQGIGDEMRFASMIPDLIKQAATVLLECEPRLQPIFARSFAATTCVARAKTLDPRLTAAGIDFQIPCGGLCRFFRPSLESFPPHEGYLKADPNRTRALRERYENGGGPVVGISWASSAAVWEVFLPHPPDWHPLLSVPGVTFVNLQYGDTAADRAAFLEHTGVDVIHDAAIDPLTDMDAFATQVAAMDLVISVGNSTVEVAGALGVPVWTLVQFEPSWVWMLEREDSPWYPSMRLYRQEKSGNWVDVMTRIAGDLRIMAEAS